MPTKDAANFAGEIASFSYEQARDQLVEVVAKLEAGNATLEESLALWERGEALAARCQQWLDGVRSQIAAATATSSPSTDSPGASTGAPANGDSDATLPATPPSLGLE